MIAQGCKNLSYFKSAILYDNVKVLFVLKS